MAARAHRFYAVRITHEHPRWYGHIANRDPFGSAQSDSFECVSLHIGPPFLRQSCGVSDPGPRDVWEPRKEYADCAWSDQLRRSPKPHVSYSGAVAANATR